MSSPNASSQIIQIYKAGIDAVKGERLIKNRIKLLDDKLLVYDLNSTTNQQPAFECELNNRLIYLIGAGKAVLGLCEGFLNAIEFYNNEQQKQQQTQENDRIEIEYGLLSVPHSIPVVNKRLFHKYNIDIRFGAKNNLPDEFALNSTRLILDFIENKVKVNANAANNKQCLLISFISGGGSALLSLPKSPLSLSEKCELISRLAKSGCDINELNRVRRCLSQVKGGKLARIALASDDGSSKVQMLNFIASDIIGDPLNLIASGPTVIDRCENPAEIAFQILNKYKIDVSRTIREVIDDEKPINEKLPSLTNVLLVNNLIAIREAQKYASSLGYKVIDMGTNISGEASNVGAELADVVLRHKERGAYAWIGGGETTVTIPAQFKGVGGRCQEMALAFYLKTIDCDENIVFLAAGTDGQDGPTPVAGCMIDVKKVAKLKEEAKIALNTHISYEFWSKHIPQALINTNGPTGVNVMDVYCMIKINGY